MPYRDNPEPVHKYRVNAAFPAESYRIVWEYSNRLVVHDKLTGRWLFFDKARDEMWTLIADSESFEQGIFFAKAAWSPRAPKVKIDFRRSCLEQIEMLVLPLIKKGQQDKLTKYDFSVVYYSGSNWRAFYPSVDELVEFHVARNGVKPIDSDYISYLNSDEFKLIREAWDKLPNVDIPQNQQQRQ